MTGALPPGWYPTPGIPGVLQWWDGIRWTGEVRDADPGPDGGGGAVPAEAAGRANGGAGDERPGQDAAERDRAGAAWRAPAVEAWAAATSGPAPRRRGIGRWLGRPKNR
jgi:Protein of unknown function (DUF2510)